MLTVQKASFDPSDDAAALRAARYSLGLDGAPQAVNPDADGHGGIWLGSQEALAQLSPKVRDAVLLRVALDLPYEVVAEQLGCTVGAARVRVSRGLEHLSPIVDLG